MKVAAVFDVALMIRFASWPEWLAVMPQKVIWRTATDELRELAIEMKAETEGDYFEPGGIFEELLKIDD